MLTIDKLDMSNGVSSIRHINKNLTPKLLKMPHLNVVVDLGELGEVVVHHMSAKEFRTIAIEPICNKHRYVIQPSVSGGCRQHDPLVVLCKLIEGLDPRPVTNKPLLIKYDHSILDIFVVGDVVPRVDHDRVCHGP